MKKKKCRLLAAVVGVSTLICILVGCTNENLPLRSQIRAGMTMSQIWDLYSYDSNDPIRSAKKIRDKELLSEQTIEKCTFKTYRYWFKNPEKNPFAKPLPYLLTFQTCRLPNYDVIQKERERRIAVFEEKLRNDPNLQMEIEAFCKENDLSQEDRKILITLLLYNFQKSPPLPRCTTDEILVKIAFDQATVRYRKTRKALREIEFIQRQAETRRWLIKGY